MAEVGNETKLILKLARERMDARLLTWKHTTSSPNSFSSNHDWMDGYRYAFDEWKNTLVDIAIELETK